MQVCWSLSLYNIHSQIINFFYQFNFLDRFLNSSLSSDLNNGIYNEMGNPTTPFGFVVWFYTVE